MDNFVPSNSTPIPMEYPKRMTAINETTGALIKSKTDNQEGYAKGWDLIFGVKKEFEYEIDDGILKYSVGEISNCLAD